MVGAFKAGVGEWRRGVVVRGDPSGREPGQEQRAKRLCQFCATVRACSMFVHASCRKLVQPRTYENPGNKGFLRICADGEVPPGGSFHCRIPLFLLAFGFGCVSGVSKIPLVNVVSWISWA